MYTPPLRNHYASILTSLLGTNSPLKSSKLLQAYVTFSAMLSYSNQDFTEAYNDIRKKYADYPYAVLPLSHRQCKGLQQEELKEFTDIPFEEFLLYVIPDVVCDPQSLMDHYREYMIDHELDQLKLVHHTISIKLNTYQTIAAHSPSTTAASTPDKVRDGLGSQVQEYSCNDSFTTIYQYYKKNQKHPLPEKIFKAFYSDINLHKLNPNELSPRLIGSSDKQLSELLNILFCDLQLTRSQSIQMVRDFFCSNNQASKICQGQRIYNFVQTKDTTKRIKLLNKALKLMAKFSPLDLICSISLRKKEGTVNERNKTEALTLPNDVSLENGLVFSLFFSALPLNSDSHILIIFPTPHFIQKVLWSHKYKECNITFVLQDSNIADVLVYQADDLSYAPTIGKNIRFLSFEQWLRFEESTDHVYDHTLVFATRMNLHIRDDITPILAERCSGNSTLLVLDTSQYIENNSTEHFENDHIVLKKIGLIPQGINNSTQPRRKLILRCSVNPQDLKTEQSAPVEIHTYTLNTDLKIQALSPMHEKPVFINRNNLYFSVKTLRQQFSIEISRRHAAGRERHPSFSHEITPDIVVWCSKTYPKNNMSRPRLEAYVCEPTPASKINSGFKERGNRITSTIKHTTSVSDEDILDWLENVYPYSVVSPKRSTVTGKQQTATSIREEIITHYTEYLQGQNIALKTLWYLYPSLSDRFSKSSYEALSSMMDTIIGSQRVCDLTSEICESLLTHIYPDFSDNALWARFEILSTMLDQAVALGYCPCNNLRLALRQADVRDKLFAQVRKALTKKHFTQSEFQKAYNYALSKVEQGEPAYWGVLFRLMTGLESKIVCALRWCDIRFSYEYNVSSAIIARQMQDDESFEGFYDNEDYLVFPIPFILQNLLQVLKNRVGIKNDNQLILSSLAASDSNTVITPKILNQFTRETILSLGINERIISLPHHDHQDRSTNLNKYNGDIVRENFRFWATEAGKFNADELAYLLRNKPASTLGCYYCDFLNEASQLILHVKLNRIEAAIAGHHNVGTKKHSCCTSSAHQFDAAIDQRFRRMVLMEVHTEDDANISIEVNSLYGVSHSITKSGEEDI